MIHDVINATYKGEYRIELEFDDGQRGVVDFSKYLNRGGVFSHFQDLDYFRSFEVDSELGTLTWGGAIDIAPETLYSEATGTDLPAWMELDDEDRRTTA